MKHLIKPAPLSGGGTIGVIAPAGVLEAERVAAGINWLEQQGYRVKQGKYLLEQQGYLAGRDEERAADIMNMFLDDTVDAILCARGGYGCMRLLPLLDYDLIRRRAKIFIGYSDITALHIAFQQKAGFVTFHGPMAASSLAGDVNPTTWSAMQGMIQEGSLAPTPMQGDFLVAGEATGRLMGGNLSIIAALMGTPYALDFHDIILCIEDVGEAPYRIDRLLTQLLLADTLKQVAGIVIGDFTDCDEDAERFGCSAKDVLAERLATLGVPILTGISFGHDEPNLTIPMGIVARISSAEGGIVLQENSTR